MAMNAPFLSMLMKLAKASTQSSRDSVSYTIDNAFSVLYASCTHLYALTHLQPASGIEGGRLDRRANAHMRAVAAAGAVAVTGKPTATV